MASTSNSVRSVYVPRPLTILACHVRGILFHQLRRERLPGEPDANSLFVYVWTLIPN